MAFGGLLVQRTKEARWGLTTFSFGNRDSVAVRFILVDGATDGVEYRERWSYGCGLMFSFPLRLLV